VPRASELGGLAPEDRTCLAPEGHDHQGLGHWQGRHQVAPQQERLLQLSRRHGQGNLWEHVQLDSEEDKSVDFLEIAGQVRILVEVHWAPRHLWVRNLQGKLLRAALHQLRKRKTPAALQQPHVHYGARRVQERKYQVGINQVC